MNAKEKQQFLEYWETTRRRGALRYILITAISWGSLSAFLVRLFRTLFDEGFSWGAFQSAYNSREYLLFWAIFILGGLFYALTMWFYYNWQYRRLRMRSDE